MSLESSSLLTSLLLLAEMIKYVIYAIDRADYDSLFYWRKGVTVVQVGECSTC